MAVATSRLLIEIDAKYAEQQARAVAKELESIEKNGDYATKSMDAMSVSARKFAGAMAGVLSVSKAISMADDYTQMAAQIRNATNSVTEYDQVQKRLLATANTTFRSLKEAQQVYLDVGGALKAYGSTTQEALRITDSLSFSYTHNATAIDKATSSTNAFMKSVYEGRATGDSWRAMLSAIPSIVNDLSVSMGKSKAEILSLGNAGEITAEQLKKALSESREESERLANNMENSLKDGYTKLSNEVTVYLGKANEATSATGMMASGLGVLADNLDTVVSITAVAAAYIAGTYIPAMYQSVAATSAKAKSLVDQSLIQYAAIQTEKSAAAQALITAEATIANTQATLRQIVAEKALEVERLKAQINQAGRIASTTRMAQLRQVEAQVTAELTLAENALATAKTRSSTAAAASMGVGRGLLGILGGPVGLGLTVAGVAASYLLMRNNTDEATESLTKQSKTISEVIQKYRELDVVRQREQLVSEKKSLDELSESYEQLSGKLRTNAYNFTRNNDSTKKQAKELNLLIGEFKKTGDIDKFSNSINQLTWINGKSRDGFNSLAGKVKGAKEEYSFTKDAVDALTRILGFNTNALNDNATAANNAAAAQTAYQKSLSDRAYYAEYKRVLIDQYNFTEAQAGEYAKLQEEAGGVGARISKEARSQANKTILEENRLRQSIEARNNAARNIKTSGSSAKSSRSTESNAAQERINSDSIRLIQEYSTTYESIERELADDILRIRQSALKMDDGARSEIIAKLRANAEAQKKIYLHSYDADLNAWKWTEEQKLANRLAISKESIIASKNMADTEKQYRKDSLDAQYAYELTLMKYVEEQRKKAYEDNYVNSLRDIQQARAIYGTPIEGRANLSIQFAEKNELSGNDKSLENTQSELQRERLEKGLVFEQEYQKRLEDAVRLHEQNKLKIKEDYAVQFDELQKSQFEGQLNQLSSVTSSLGGYWSNMTGVIKDAAGEQSSIYKGMFLAQQAFALTSATVNALQAYNQVLANPWTFDPISKQTMASTILGMGMANVGLIAGQTISGMAHSGIDNIPREGTWLLDKGERVLSPRQNEDLTRYLSQKGSGGGDVETNVYVTVSSDGSSQTDSQGASKELGDLIANAVRKVILQEKRQGGLLA